jgi:lysozyme family protein
VWEAWVGYSVDEKEMRSLTKELVAPLYKSRYWDAVHGDQLPSGADYLAFDFAVNAGAFRSIKTIQRALNITADGIIGPVTLKAIQDTNAEEFIDNFTDAKESFYQRFGKLSYFWQEAGLTALQKAKKAAEGMLT